MDEDFREAGMRNFSVIGAGNVGANLIGSLEKKGYTLRYIFKKSRYDYYAPFVTTDISAVIKEADFVVIGTQESRISEAVAHAAASAKVSGKIFFHTSNSLTSDQLQPLREKGAFVASFSPLQTFPRFDANIDVYKGIYCLGEGDEPAMILIRELARDLEAHLLEIPKQNKIFLHIAGVCASNFLIGVLKLAERQIKKTGDMDIDILMPLIKQTIKNVERKGVEASLTGPVKRGETAIVQKHLSVLENQEAELYKLLSEFLKSRF